MRWELTEQRWGDPSATLVRGNEGLNQGLGTGCVGRRSGLGTTTNGEDKVWEVRLHVGNWGAQMDEGATNQRMRKEEWVWRKSNFFLLTHGI